MNISSSEGISGEEKVRPMRQRHRMYGEKVCAVCGDKALAHHFGTLACETCKAFFRRNALKNQVCPLMKKYIHRLKVVVFENKIEILVICATFKICQ